MPSPANPTARTEDLVVTEAGGDTLVYDLRTNRAHSLDLAATAFWLRCDGTRDLDALAASLRESAGDPATCHDVARYTLARLRAAGLLREGEASVAEATAGGGRPMSRRALLRRAAAAGATVVAVPTILSVVAPTTLQAQASCLPGGTLCVIGGTPCCAPFTCRPNTGQTPGRSCQ